ncbi:MAG: GNAT family N-acetyltransferase [Angustibacter sp.]
MPDTRWHASTAGRRHRRSTAPQVDGTAGRRHRRSTAPQVRRSGAADGRPALTVNPRPGRYPATVGTAVTDNISGHRFEVRVDGELAGFASYRPGAGQYTITHTEVQPRFAHQGVGTVLVREAMQQARDRGLAVVPACSFVTRYLHDHPYDLELVPAADRARLGLPTD